MGGTNKQKQKQKNWQWTIIADSDWQRDRPDLSSEAQQRQHSEIQTELISGRKSQGGLDAKTCWLTDR
jgi:hypothetical protein